jgi:quercetin dioxygenase-like cupin family protein
MSLFTSDGDIVTLPYRRGRAIGESQWFMGALFTWLARAADTGGAFALADVQARQGTEPPAHTHTHEDEAYVLLDGDVTWHVGAAVHHVAPGQFVYLPRGLQHEFRINGPEAHFLVLVTPAGLEATFDALSRPAPTLTLPPPPDGPPPPEFLERMLRLCTEAGVRFAAPAP